jgi:hypothetical protein
MYQIPKLRHQFLDYLCLQCIITSGFKYSRNYATVGAEDHLKGLGYGAELNNEGEGSDRMGVPATA